MYYSSGNYEAFARPRKPAGVDRKRAWFVGSGLASLAGAAFLVRDGLHIGAGNHGGQLVVVESALGDDVDLHGRQTRSDRRLDSGESALDLAAAAAATTAAGWIKG